ncbi:MAG: hypothetical protein CM15mP124_3640 [Alphaproteobacteria bacterium]|nr:MAG: hypothetical protein CM15mP124_3640 [Alphaproteobacteria bacterium]
MSIGFLIDEKKPLVWRGPMLQSAIMQLINDVEWNFLDYLIIDFSSRYRRYTINNYAKA